MEGTKLWAVAIMIAIGMVCCPVVTLLCCLGLACRLFI